MENKDIEVEEDCGCEDEAVEANGYNAQCKN